MQGVSQQDGWNAAAGSLDQMGTSGGAHLEEHN